MLKFPVFELKMYYGHFLLLCWHACRCYAVVSTGLVQYEGFRPAVAIPLFVHNYASNVTDLRALSGRVLVRR